MSVHAKYSKAAMEFLKVNGEKPKYVAIEAYEIETFLEELRQTTVGFIFPNRTAFDKHYVRIQIFEGTLIWMGMKVIVKEQVLI